MKTISILMSSVLLTVASTGFVAAAGTSAPEADFQINTPFIVADARSVQEEHRAEKAGSCKDYDDSSEHGEGHDERNEHDDRDEHDRYDDHDEDRNHDDCDRHDEEVEREHEHERSSRSHG